ncbi:MAG: hypothetical protein ABL949_04150 [Fimbriimonadaceae bacterium]
MKVRVACPAKLNLFLAVGPQDERRYHPIRTIFQAISWFDYLTISDESPPGFFCDALPDENTVTRAHRLLQEYTSLPPLNITLEKHIPSEAGLGGGSSDAAGFLKAVQPFALSPIPTSHLNDVAYAVGMDTPFFLVGGRAKGEGYGEKLTPLPDPAPSIRFIVVKPVEGVSSKQGYAKLDELTYDFRDFPTDDKLYNDFERVAPCICLDLIERMVTLGCKQAGLTGSGSAVFGVTDETEGPRIRSDLMRYGLDPKLVEPLPASFTPFV